MFQTKLEELELAEAAQLAGIDPFTLRDRLLMRAWKGKCCFDMGLAVKCLETTIEITEGSNKSLELSAHKIAGLNLTTTHTFTQKIVYGCGSCDSIEPLVIYEDAYVHVWEVRTTFLFGSWKRNETVFIPTKRPFIASNKIRNDAECGCESADPPTAGPDDQIALAVEQGVTRLLSTWSLSPSRPDEELPDPVEAAGQALLGVEEALQPFQTQRPEQVGFMDMRGQVIWFSGVDTNPEKPPMMLLSTDCNAPLRRRLAILEDDTVVPILAIAPTSRATSGRLVLSLDEGGKLVRFDEVDVEVACDSLAVAWASLDVGAFKGGISGQIEIELYDESGEPVVRPLIEEFTVVTTPTTLGTVLEAAPLGQL